MIEFLHHHLYSVLGILSIFTTLFFAQIVSGYGRHKNNNRAFIFYMNFAAFEALCYTMRAFQTEPTWYYAMDRWLLSPCLFFAAYIYIDFIARFCEWGYWKKWRIRLVFILPSFAFTLISVLRPELFFRGIKQTPFGPTSIPGPAWLFFGLFIVALIIQGLFLFWARFHRTNFDRTSFFLVMLGNILLMGLSIIFDVILPLYTNNYPSLTFLGFYLFTICLFFAIIRNQKLFDIERALVDFEKLKFFNKTSLALDEEISHEKLMGLFVENTRKASGAISVIYLEISTSNAIRLAFCSEETGNALEQIMAHTQSMGISINKPLLIPELNVRFINEILKTGSPFIASDFNSFLGDKAPYDLDKFLKSAIETKCIAALPVKVVNQVRGILVFSMKQAERDFTLYHLFSNQCSQILRNHELLESYRKARDEQAILLNNIPTQIWYLKNADTFGSVNSAFARFYSLNPQQIEGKGLQDIVTLHPSLEAVLSKCIRVFETHQKAEFEEWIVSPEGEKRLFLISQTPKINIRGEIDYVVCVGSDITELRKLETQIYQSQKMDAIGQLAGGVAHNFNNLLLTIIGYAELITGESKDTRIEQFAGRIVMAGQHGSNLAQQLLTFARKGQYEVSKVNITHAVDEVIALIQNTFDKRIRIERTFSTQNPFTTGDSTQLMQMLLNLALNARDAMPEGGRLVFNVSDSILDEAFCRNHEFARTGRYLHIVVSDTGSGMPPHVRAHVFEPFFTTKEPGKGFGLGLASVYGCVKNHNGFIILDTAEGKGTHFDIYLPYASEAQAVSKKPSANNTAAPGGQSRIMIVEDEEDVRTVTALTLRKMGYTVQSFGNGHSAIDYYKENHDSVDIVLLDVTMPEMNGMECMQALMAIKSDVRIIIASGHTFEGEPHLLAEKGAMAFIQKPWKRTELARIIEKVLTKNR